MEHEVIEVEFISKIDVMDEIQFAVFRKQLEEFEVVDWTFDFWDVKACFGIKTMIDDMVSANPKAHIILQRTKGNECNKH